MNAPHPLLVPLLEEHDIPWALFCVRGRPPMGVREKRSRIVTALHETGMPWAQMMEVTGLSNGAIQRLTQAMHNQASKENQRAVGRRVGASWKGKDRHDQLMRQWQNGTFDFHRGRVRPEAERAALKASWTPEVRAQGGVSSKQNVWGRPEVAERLLAFHRSPEERARRSALQVERMKTDPAKYAKGRIRLVDTPKGNQEQISVRSSYEALAVKRLEADPQVQGYVFEPVLRIPGGKWIMPDFLVDLADGQRTLVEIKASWVFKLPMEHKVSVRLETARCLAVEQGWGFAVWTEKELKDVVR